MKDIQNRLFEIRDEENALFQAKLTPGIPADRFLGTRMPDLRKLASDVKNLPETAEFLEELPHFYYDENMLHSVLIEKCSDYKKVLHYLDRFLPFVDNWAVCDTMRPVVFKKHRKEILPLIKDWMSSSETYTCRFGVDMLMTHFLDEDFKTEYLELPAKIKSEEYYVNMMIAWYYATALAKQWDSTIPYIEEHRLSSWVHKKSIQKAIESFRITAEQKDYLKTLR